MHIGLKIFIWGVLGLVVFGALLFGPAGTFDYWQAWVFLAAFVSTTIGPTIYLARNDPAALQRRMRSGPLAEGRTIQKFIVIGAFLGFFAMMVLSACDHRYGWSSVPAAVCVIGDVLVMTGLGIAMLVVIQNRYAASTVRVEAGPDIGLRRSLQNCPTPDVRRERGHDDRHTAGTGLLLGDVHPRPRHTGVGVPHPRRGKTTDARTQRVPRIPATGALPVGALRVVAVE